MKTSSKVRFSAIDMFCGIGGLSLGLRRAGFKVVAAIDNDDLSAETYRMNHQRTYLIKDDIQAVDPDKLMEHLEMEAGDLDLLAGCPPCQGFSTLRTYNGGREVNEPMNDLVFEFTRFAKVFMPKTLMMENVPALIADARLENLRKKLRALGYECDAKVFDATQFGVPQRRSRMIFIASRKGRPEFAVPVNRCWTVEGAIRRLPSPKKSEDPAHNYSVSRSVRVISLIRRVPKDGGSRAALPAKYQLECHRKFSGFKDVYGRMAWRKPAPTITGGCISPSKGRYIHPNENRAITLREAALLQRFPGSYEFDFSKGRHSVAQLIGNAFPPKFAEHHARSLYQHLEESLFPTN